MKIQRGDIGAKRQKRRQHRGITRFEGFCARSEQVFKHLHCEDAAAQGLSGGDRKW